MHRRDARVLLVDSSAVSRLATHHALRALGCRIIEEASTGAEALALLRAEHFDLVITEWTLADQPARRLLRAVRDEPRWRTLPVVASVRVTAELVSDAADTGLNGFLPRPFGLEALDATLTLFVGRRSVAGPASRRAYVS